MGYCTQYNLALKQLLDCLGFDTWAVFSLRGARGRQAGLDDGPHLAARRSDGWGDANDVCAGHADNLPGRVNFTPLAPVWPGNDFVLTLTHLGMIGLCGFLEWRSLLTGRPLPGWMFEARGRVQAEQFWRNTCDGR